MRDAYLIVICSLETNAVLSAAIWSSPEWEQSRHLKERTYVAYSVRHPESFHKARLYLADCIKDSKRYAWLIPYLDQQTREELFSA